MLLGLVTFVYGKNYLYGKESKNPELLDKKIIGIKTEWLIYIASILSVFVFWQMVQSHEVVSSSLMVAGSLSVIYILYYSITQVDKKAREQLFALTILIVFTIIFWALFEQAYTSLNLFADRVLDRAIYQLVTF